jgi:hypothetical protein
MYNKIVYNYYKMIVDMDVEIEDISDDELELIEKWIEGKDY